MKLTSKDPEVVAENEMTVKAKQKKLAKVKKDIGIPETFYNEANNQWSNIACCNIGHVHWDPKISVDIQGHSYTRDIGMFQIDVAKFKVQFKGNIVN